METVLLFLVLLLNLILAALMILTHLRVRRSGTDGLPERLEAVRRDMEAQQRALRQEVTQTVQDSMTTLGDLLSKNLNYASQLQSQQYDALQRALAAQFSQIEHRLRTFSLESEQKFDGIRQTVERRLSSMQEDNNRRLQEMRQVVDEKLQRTLDEKMARSFAAVSERLEQVYRGLGEMRTLAAGVGDLKKVLSNVKTRGILGEVQLGAILEEILSPEQYDSNVAVTPGSRNVVEFAVKLPAEDGGRVYLPIDSKFPGDSYAALRDAYDSGVPEAVSAAWANLQAIIRSEAKDIRDKYIDPPHTTEFAVLFLPFEGLYAEVVNRGMIELLQHEYRVNVAGPSTMAALLNSLQMGFKAFALQKRSSEVWKTLSAVKTEFDRFADVLRVTQQRLEQANTELDKLIGVRTRQIQRALKEVTTLDGDAPAAVLPGREPAHLDP